MADTAEYWMITGFFLLYTILILILGLLGVGGMEETCGNINQPAACVDGVSFSEGFSSIFVNPFSDNTYESLIMILVFVIPMVIISTLFIINVVRGR